MSFPEVERRFTMKEAVDYTCFKYHNLRRHLLRRGGFFNVGLGSRNIGYLIPQSTLDDIMRESCVPRKQGGRS